MQKPMNDLIFRLMSLEFRLKAIFADPARMLREAGLGEGMFLLDFGCGPGRFALPAARIVGRGGRVYALDIHPLALRTVEQRARRSGLVNVETLLSEGVVPLPDGAVDFVLLYDTLHDVADRPKAVAEIMRVLKAGGVLSYRDHHLGADAAMNEPVSEGLIRRIDGGGEVVSFLRSRPQV